jgi:hypothetical protein
MDGNDTYGDCGPAATDHGNMAKAANPSLLNSLGEPKYAGTVATYLAYTGGQDTGVDNASWLGWLWKQGIIDGYGEVPLDQVREYAVQFNGVLLGCLLGDDAESDFENGVPWDDPPAPDPNDGHDILLIGYKADGTVQYVTWGGLQWVTANWQAKNPTDAWAILDKDDPTVDWQALETALITVHGVLPPTKPPTPSPAGGGCLMALMGLFR